MLRSGNMGFETQWVQKIFLQTVPGTQPVSYSMDRPSGVFARGQRDGGLKLTAHRHPVPRLNMSGVTSLFLHTPL